MNLDIEWLRASTLTEITLLALAFVLSSMIGLERHRNLKSAGLRTHALVGVGSAVFTLVSAYGFSSVAAPDAIVDPSRIAAQVVSGIGFLGAGVIFVRQNSVAGLTTAASIWMTASIGMACGAGSPSLAIAGTAIHLFAVWALRKLGNRLRPSTTSAVTTVRVRYREGRGALRTVLGISAASGFEAIVSEVREVARGTTKAPRREVLLTLRSEGGSDPLDLVEILSDVPGVDSIRFVGERP
ncbi:MgtC/SapB family protein [Microbacterium sp. 1.5R]|uniref:MgtC/SapB family protein n=1 Tax=Microbacterium sp. 1.5R TaxID=1916917 RepID=UPI0021B3D791|nr:MgtC/SapB family protein [Microbacterium sp. 1.5R]